MEVLVTHVWFSVDESLNNFPEESSDGVIFVQYISLSKPTSLVSYFVYLKINTLFMINISMNYTSNYVTRNNTLQTRHIHDSILFLKADVIKVHPGICTLPLFVLFLIYTGFFVFNEKNM